MNRGTAARDFEELGIQLCKTNPDVEPVLLTLDDIRDYVSALGKNVPVPEALDQGTLQAIRFAWCAEFLDRTV